MLFPDKRCKFGAFDGSPGTSSKNHQSGFQGGEDIEICPLGLKTANEKVAQRSSRSPCRQRSMDEERTRC